MKFASFRERESGVVVFQSPISFKDAEARINYMNHRKNAMQEIPETEHEELKKN